MTSVGTSQPWYSRFICSDCCKPTPDASQASIVSGPTNFTPPPAGAMPIGYASINTKRRVSDAAAATNFATVASATIQSKAAAPVTPSTSSAGGVNKTALAALTGANQV